MKTHYTSHYLAEFLRDLYFEESSGVLEVANPQGEAVRLFFDRGMLVFGDGTAPSSTLDHHLISSGILPASTVAKLAKTSATPIQRADRLVVKNVTPKDSMRTVIRSLVEACSVRAFSWPSGNYEFTPQDHSIQFFDPDVLFTFECILKGILDMAHFEPLKDVLLKQSNRLRISDKFFLPVQQLALRPHHGYILSRVDGSLPLEQLAMLMPPGEEDASLRFLYGLAVLGILEFDPPFSEGLFSLRDIMQGHYESEAKEKQDINMIKETAARITRQTPAEILGIGETTEPGELRRAFDRVRFPFQRTRFSKRVAEEYRKELSLIDNKMAEAFLKFQVDGLEEARRQAQNEVGNTVSTIDPDKLGMRREMVKSSTQTTLDENRSLAAKYLEKAQEFYKERDFHNTIQFCQLAIKFNEEDPATYMLMAGAMSRNPNAKWQRMAEEAFQRACELDPWNADYRVRLGSFYRTHGLEEKAKEQFRKALEIVPDHKWALEQIGRCGATDSGIEP